jgi:hypothetical protein
MRTPSQVDPVGETTSTIPTTKQAMQATSAAVSAMRAGRPAPRRLSSVSHEPTRSRPLKGSATG